MKKDEIGVRLRSERERVGLSRDQVVAQINYSRSTLQQWEAGSTEPPISVIAQLAILYKVSPQYLIFGTDSDTPTPAPASTTDTNDEYYYVPYYRDVIASAGGGKFSDGVIGTDDFLAFRKEWVERTGLIASELVAINTDGDSMLPTIPENATILVDKSKNRAKDGRIYVVRIGDQLYIKRIQWLPNGLRLISDNAIYNPIDLSKTDLESAEVEIYGQVVHISHDLPH